MGGAGGAPGAALTDELVRIASEPYGVFYIEADDSHVYFTDWGGPVWRVDHAGAGRIQLANSAAYHMLSDATHLYFTTDVDIQRVAKTGGPAEVLVTLRDVSKVTAAALELALDQTYVYASTYEDGTVVRVPKTGGESRVLAQATDYMGGVAVSGGALYWAEYGQGGVYRTDLETGDRTLFYPGGAWRLQAVGADLWFAPVSEAAIVRAPFDGAGVTRYPFETYTTHFRGDDTHVYWVWSALVRRSLITGIEEKVADLPVHAAANVALTPHWIFVGDSSSSNGGLYRLPKPAP